MIGASTAGPVIAAALARRDLSALPRIGRMEAEVGRAPSERPHQIGLLRSGPWSLSLHCCGPRCRWFEGRLLYPDEAELQVHMVIEQIPCPDNRISLASDKLDMFGQLLTQIEWSVGSEDVDNVVRATDAFRTMWKFIPSCIVRQVRSTPSGGVCT